MQDIKELDSRGVPGGFIASNVFTNAAQARGEAVGFHPNKLFVQHPIQDRTDDELRDLADENLEAILADSHLYYRSTKHVYSGQELLVWYTEDLAKLVGVPEIHPAFKKG